MKPQGNFLFEKIKEIKAALEIIEKATIQENKDPGFQIRVPRKGVNNTRIIVQNAINKRNKRLGKPL